MIGTIIGGYSFKSKKDNNVFCLSVQVTKNGAVGTTTENVFSSALPEPMESMLNKKYMIDVGRTNFVNDNGFYPITK